MKHHLLLILLATLSPSLALAQQSNYFNYQLNVGTSLSIPHQKTVEIYPGPDGYVKNYASDFGYFVEFLISYNLKKKFSLSSGINYHNSSLKLNENYGFIESKGKLKRSAFAIPLLVNFRISDQFPLTVSAGPYLSFLVEAKEKGTTYIDTSGFVLNNQNDPTIQNLEPEQEYTIDVAKNYSLVDYGLILQLSYDIRLNSSLHGVILSRFNYGLKDVLTNGFEDDHPAGYWKNYSLLLGVGLRF